MTLGWNNTSSSFRLFFRIHVIRLLIGISACVCSGLSLPIVLLWVYMFHMRCFACSLLHWYILNITFSCLICCAAPVPPPSLSFSSDLTIFPCLNKYIYIYPSFFAFLFGFVVSLYYYHRSPLSYPFLPSGTVTCATFCATKKNRERNAAIQLLRCCCHL